MDNELNFSRRAFCRRSVAGLAGIVDNLGHFHLIAPAKDSVFHLFQKILQFKHGSPRLSALYARPHGLLSARPHRISPLASIDDSSSEWQSI